MKKCTDCRLPQELENFSFDKSRNRYLSVCKKCSSIRTENYRQNNKDKWRDQSKTHFQKRKKAIDGWKKEGCKKCGDKREYVIDAHHTDPNIKTFSIGDTRRGINIVLNELKKCIPLCSNCHREFHYLEKTKGLTINQYVNG